MARKNLGEAAVIAGHVLEVLASLEAESVSCVVTSPPYWSLRKYDAPDVVWGGEPGCEHEWGPVSKEGAAVEGYAGKKKWQHSVNGRGEDHPEARHRRENPDDWTRVTRETSTCARCGAWCGQYGLEPTPELYVEHTLEVLRAIRRVLRPDGVVWWNIGDGYASSPSGNQKWTGWETGGVKDASDNYEQRSTVGGALKPKDLVLMPFRVALAAQAGGWWVRSVVIWSKPNAMPESTKDRPTTAHEYLLMLTKNSRYWYDQEAVREPISQSSIERISQPTFDQQAGGAKDYGRGTNPNRSARRTVENLKEKWSKSGQSRTTDGLHEGRWDQYINPVGRNLRSVWEFPTAQTPEAHFATFPEELPRRCIEASCPREICAKCGTARVRLVEKTDEPDTRAKGSRFDAGKTAVNGEGRAQEGGRFLDTTTGWISCDCAEPDYQSGIVLDPFAGIGTTGVVAKRLGRRFIGIELSEKYAGMARDKLRFFWKKTNLSEPKLRPGQSKLPLG